VVIQSSVFVYLCFFLQNCTENCERVCAKFL